MRSRRAPEAAALRLGIVLIGIGIGGFLLAFLTDVEVAGGKPIAWLLAGGQAMIIGTMLICHHRLMERTTANDQALKFQYDIGYEDGYRERGKTARPVLVDMEAHRCHHDHAVSH